MAGQYTRCLEKLARFKKHVAFSARCKKEGVLPPSLRIKPPVDTWRGKEIADRASWQFLNERLRIANWKRKKLEDEAKWRQIGLQRAIDEEDFEKVNRISREHAEKTFLQVREKQREKFSRIFAAQQNHRERNGSNAEKGCHFRTPDKKNWVLNFSKHELTDTERKTLQRGLNFSHCPSKIPREDIIAGVETALGKCKDRQQAERVRATVAGVLATAKTPKQNTSREEREAIKNLQGRDDIVILPADKGNATVVLDRQEYEKKAMELLSKPPFKKLTKDPT